MTATAPTMQAAAITRRVRAAGHYVITHADPQRPGHVRVVPIVETHAGAVAAAGAVAQLLQAAGYVTAPIQLGGAPGDALTVSLPATTADAVALDDAPTIAEREARMVAGTETTAEAAARRDAERAEVAEALAAGRAADAAHPEADAVTATAQAESVTHAPAVAPVVASAIAAEYAGDIRAGLAAAGLMPAATAPASAAETVRRAGIHVVDVEHVAPGAVLVTVQPGNARHAAAALIRAGYDTTVRDAARVLAVEPEPADLVDPAPAETYGTTPGQAWPPQASRYAAPVDPKATRECRECGRRVRPWGTVAHWQTHNPNHPHATCCGAPRDEVAALFRDV